jgi:GNAT superfamily N-acetyltransferase
MCTHMSAAGGQSESHPLDNAVWCALGTRHTHLSEVRGRARRYDTNVSVFGAVDCFDAESWDDLAGLIGPSRTCALFRRELPEAVPAGWTVRARGHGRQMTLGVGQLVGVKPVDVRRLTTEDVPLMLELVATTNPGPFRPATIAMGQYYGHFEGERLLSMAGERLRFEGYTEISAVCTHPDAWGRGLASALTHHVASGIFARGERPFLHVADSNEVARRVYEHLGFIERQLVTFALVEAPPAPPD